MVERLSGKHTFDTDECMKSLYFHLDRDFRAFYKVQGLDEPLELIMAGRIKEFRELTWASRSNLPPHLFKWLYQLETLYKRYRFKDDAYTDEELYAKSFNSFMATQARVGTPLQMTPFVLRVVKEARNIIRDVLGEYSLEEHQNACKFGKRACKGHEYRKSYLDLKVSGPITGSVEHIGWFKKYLLSDQQLADIIHTTLEKGGQYEVCSHLSLALVPKNWKSLRPVKPQTLLGTFITNGLGTVLTKRLLAVGLNIKRLQETHKRLVKRASTDGLIHEQWRLVTADLSAASDSISWELLCRLLPRKWLRAVMHGCARYVTDVSGNSHRLSSVATMGDGHTFPLQTLIFYSLIKAVGKLKGYPDAFVSVYGDDLIYPRTLHEMVVHTLRCLHFNLNKEKTYATGSFRESCGSDCYRGIDVRPFSPEGEHRHYSAGPYAAFLYKLLNGLLRRWEWEELPSTVDYLLSELWFAAGDIFCVPPSYPDYAGVRVSKPFNNDIRLSQPLYHPKKQQWSFRCLHETFKDRIVVRQDIYLWEHLRQKAGSLLDQAFDAFHPGSNPAWNDDIEQWTSCEDLPVLSWRKTKPPVYYTCSKTRKRIRRKVACVPRKGTSRVVSQTDSTSAWI